MVIKCPTCEAALIYNPASGKMECLYCNNEYDVEETDLNAEVNASLEDEHTIKCNVYRCTECGGEIAINGVESATFCSYCGQPTIVFDRVTATKKPKYIIPFSHTKEEAVDNIRKKILKGFFVPRDFRKFAIERVRGIYVPYWIYDITYEDRQSYKGIVQDEFTKREEVKYFYREGKCYFQYVTLDASLQLADDSSERLGDYNMSELTPFDMKYFSGFYADCYDFNEKQLQEFAVQRVQGLFDGEIRKSISTAELEMIYSHPNYEITRADYAMFPVWFLTLVYNDESYTILENGQNGNVVGAVPYDKGKIVILTAILAVVFSSVTTFFLKFLCWAYEDAWKLVLFVYMMILPLWGWGSSTYRSIRNSIDLSKSNITESFVRERQEK